jgi:hypothetical protein
MFRTNRNVSLQLPSMYTICSSTITCSPPGPRVTSVLHTPISGGRLRTFLYRQLLFDRSGSDDHIAQTSPRATVPPGQLHGIQGWSGALVLKAQPVGLFQPTQSLVPNTHSVGRAGSDVSSTNALAKDLYWLPGIMFTPPPVSTGSLLPCPSSACCRMRKYEPLLVHGATPGEPFVLFGLLARLCPHCRRSSPLSAGRHTIAPASSHRCRRRLQAGRPRRGSTTVSCVRQELSLRLCSRVSVGVCRRETYRLRAPSLAAVTARLHKLQC